MSDNTILTYTEIDREAWSRLVQTSGTGTWFQTPEAYMLFASMPDLFRPFAIAVERVNGLTDERSGIRGICAGYVTVEKNPLKQFFTRRAIILGGPCLAEDAKEEEVTALLSAIKAKLSTGSDVPIYIEIRNFNDYRRWRGAFEAAGFAYQPHLNFHVDCREKEKMWERLSDNRKRQIRRVTNEGVKELSNERISEEEIREWYGILQELYRTKVRTPLLPVEFFLEAKRQGAGTFLLIRHEGKIIGGSMVVELTNERRGCVYEWYECGLNAAYKEQYPSVMATWAGMQYANEQGCARYDMMGAGEPGVPYGVRDFKAEFGGEMVEHGRWLYVVKPLLYAIGKAGVKAIKHS